MPVLISQVAKLLITVLTAFFAFFCFYGTFRHKSKKARRFLYGYQLAVIYLVLSLAFLSMFMTRPDPNTLLLYFGSLGVVTAIQLVFRFIYHSASILLTNSMCLLLSFGFIMQTRLEPEKAMRSLIFAAVSLLITAFFPLLLNKRKGRLRNLKWTYFIIGIVLLLIVFLAGQTSYGAKLSISFFGISIQPSEFVKLLYVFFLAAMYHESKSRKQILITTACAAATVLLLVGARDLGGGLIFFVIFIVMSFCALKLWLVPLAGVLMLLFTFPAAGKIFSHVHTRILAWRDPLSVIDDAGYQVSQSLFALGTGSWFGTGLYHGRPDLIPVVIRDFIFSAIGEEMGVLVCISLILICFCCVLLFFNMALEMKDEFYRLVALGLGTAYGFQVFLTIGGCIKLIPSTGVTLPLVSYGGSSLLATFMSFGILQGLYVSNKGKGGEFR